MKPHLLHRQSGIATQNRRVIYPWFVATLHDGSLESKQLGSYARISRAHRLLEHPRMSPLRAFQPGSHIPGRFTPSVELRGLGPLLDALVGQRDWSSPAVRAEAALFLEGTAPAEEVKTRMMAWRANAIKQYKEAFRIF